MELFTRQQDGEDTEAAQQRLDNLRKEAGRMGVSPRGRGRGRRGGRGGRGAAGARRGPIIDQEIKIPQEQMLERTKGQSYRANDCHTSGFDDFEAKRDDAKYGFHHQVVPGKNKKLMLQVSNSNPGLF